MRTASHQIVIGGRTYQHDTRTIVITLDQYDELAKHPLPTWTSGSYEREYPVRVLREGADPQQHSIEEELFTGYGADKLRTLVGNERRRRQMVADCEVAAKRVMGLEERGYYCAHLKEPLGEIEDRIECPFGYNDVLDDYGYQPVAEVLAKLHVQILVIKSQADHLETLEPMEALVDCLATGSVPSEIERSTGSVRDSLDLLRRRTHPEYRDLFTLFDPHAFFREQLAGWEGPASRFRVQIGHGSFHVARWFRPPSLADYAPDDVVAELQTSGLMAPDTVIVTRHITKAPTRKSPGGTDVRQQKCRVDYRLHEDRLQARVVIPRDFVGRGLKPVAIKFADDVVYTAVDGKGNEVASSEDINKFAAKCR